MSDRTSEYRVHPYTAAGARLAAGAPTLTAVMTRFLPGALLSWMIGLGADAVAGDAGAAQVVPA